MIFALFGASAPGKYIVSSYPMWRGRKLRVGTGGAILGGLFNAIFEQTSFWPWTFWTMGIVCLVYTTTSFLIMPADNHDPRLVQPKPSFDFANTITDVSGLVLFNFAWNQAAVVGCNVPCTDIYILLVVGFLFFAFLYIEVHIAEYPLVLINSLSKEAIYALSIIACG